MVAEAGFVPEGGLSDLKVGLLIEEDLAQLQDPALWALLRNLKGVGFSLLAAPPPISHLNELELSVPHFHKCYFVPDQANGAHSPSSPNHVVPNGNSAPDNHEPRSVPTAYRNGLCRKRPRFSLDELSPIAYNQRPWLILPYLPEKGTEIAESALKFCSTRRGDVWVRVPFAGEQEKNEGHSQCAVSGKHRYELESKASRYFFDIMTATEYHPRIFVALEIPSCVELHLLRLDHWVSEPVDCLILSEDAFAEDEKTKKFYVKEYHHAVIRKLLMLNKPTILLKFRGGATPSVSDTAAYVKLLKECYANDLPRASPQREPITRLVHTMQPLYTNLEPDVYANFQTDVVKYELYESAMVDAMMFLRNKRRPPSENETEFVMAVLGCGGGPLVDRAFAAADVLSAKVRVYAVDKNPKAVNIVKKKVEEEWRARDVILQFADMREWRCPEKLDLIVHEMLGCFADDECSPECLESPQKYLKSDGISIPGSYTSCIMPISSTRLYGELRKIGPSKRLQEMWAFSMSQFDFLGLAPREERVLTFRHAYDAPEYQTREAAVTFSSLTDGLMHGFVGYFDSILYGRVNMTTIIGRRTPGLTSWSSVFFPLMEPIYIRKGDMIRLTFWRYRGPESVWYEWQLTQPAASPVHNVGGSVLSFPLVIQEDVVHA